MTHNGCLNKYVICDIYVYKYIQIKIKEEKVLELIDQSYFTCLDIQSHFVTLYII